MNGLEIVIPFVLIFCLLVGWFLTETLNKKTDKLLRLHWILYVLISFLIFIILAIPLIILKINFLIILLVACSPLCFMFGVSTSMTLAHYKKNQNEKNKIKNYYKKLEAKERKKQERKEQKKAKKNN